MNKYTINVRRDSVSMGDDINAPHEYTFKLSENTTLNELFEHLEKNNYLASVSGKNHSWEATINNRTIALFLGNNKTPEPSVDLVNQISKYVINGSINVNFIYKSAST